MLILSSLFEKQIAHESHAMSAAVDVPRNSSPRP